MQYTVPADLQIPEEEMAVFCTNCGASLKDGSVFCINCGAAAQSSAASPAPEEPPAPAAGAAKKGSPLVKILIVCLVVFAGLGAIGLVGAVYVAYRVKRTVSEAAKARGVDLSAFSESSAYKGRLPAPCSLLTKEEASAILGLTIVRSEPQGETCNYYAQPMTEEQRQAQISKSMEEMQARAKGEEAGQAAGAGEDANKLARERGMEQLAKTMIGGANPGTGPYFTVEVSENGKAQIAAVKLAMGAVAPGMKVSETLSGLGDEAILGPMDSLLVFTRRGLGVQIDLRQVPNGRDRGVAMARQMLRRM